jgi:hypothetical protein
VNWPRAPGTCYHFLIARDPKQLYIAGFSRSGSTVLGQTLGAIPDWFDCGELCRVTLNRPCGCGAPVFECELWGPILRRIRAEYPEVDSGAFAELERKELAGGLSGFAAISREATGASVNGTPMRRYADLHVDLSRQAARATGARLIVDSSKAAALAHLVASLTDADLYVLHLVRDPRAAAYSWSKVMEKPKGYDDVTAFMAPQSIWSSCHQWVRRNALIEGLVRRKLPGDRYLRVRYEDFVERPRKTLEEICAFVGEPQAMLPLVDERTVRLKPNHTVGGNPARFSVGEVELRLDREWEARMRPLTRRLATVLTAPIAVHYHYPLRAGR